MLNRSATRIASAALALLLAPACTEKGRSLILVDIEADPSLTDLKGVRVTATQGTNEVGSNTFDWMSSVVNHLSVYVPKNVTGTVTVAAEGHDASGTKIAMSTMGAASDTSRDVQPGTVSQPPANLHLMPWTQGPGTGGAGGSGTGGTGGGTSGGSGGTNTGGVGTGGGAGGRAGAGTGGSAATGGSTGAGWRGATMVEGDVLFDDWTPSVAVDSAGNATVVYRHGPNIKANRYTAAAGWATPVTVDGRSGGQAYSPSVGVDSSGRWLVIWQQDESKPFAGIWQSTSTDGVAWSPPTAISAVAGFGAELSVNRTGAAVAAWSAVSAAGGTMVIMASVRTTAMAAWSTPMEMRPSTATTSLIEKVAMSGTGEAFVIWEDYDDRPTDHENSIWLRRFSANAWKPAALVETYNGGGSDASDVAANNAGQAIVTWRQSSAAATEVWASTFSAAGVQTPPAMVAQATSIPWDPAISVALDETGVATIAWATLVQGKFNVYTSRAAAGQTWPTAMMMETDNQAALVSNQLLDEAKPAPIVRVDAAGNVFLVWRKRVGATRFDLWGLRFSAGAWAPTATLLETDDAAVGGVSFPTLGVGMNGTAATAWYYRVADSDPTTNRIWANVWR